MGKARELVRPKVFPEVTVPLDSLHEDPENARAHPDENLSDIRASLREFGQVEALVVRRGTGRVIGGNGRLTAMRQLGWTECRVVEWKGTDSQARALGIALNRTAESAGWIDLVLADHLRSLQSEDFDLSAVGFDADEVDRLIAGLADRTLDTHPGTDGATTDGDVDDGDDAGPDADGDASAPDPTRLFPLPILLTRSQLKGWEDYKAEIGVYDDTKAFLEAVDL